MSFVQPVSVPVIRLLRSNKKTLSQPEERQIRVCTWAEDCSVVHLHHYSGSGVRAMHLLREIKSYPLIFPNLFLEYCDNTSEAQVVSHVDNVYQLNFFGPRILRTESEELLPSSFGKDIETKLRLKSLSKHVTVDLVVEIASSGHFEHNRVLSEESCVNFYITQKLVQSLIKGIFYLP